MIAFLISAGLVFGSMNMAFQQGQDNPDANGFLDSVSYQTNNDVYGVDVVGK